MEKVKVLVAQSSPTLCDPMNCSPSGSSAHGILQARILEWIAISFSRGSSPLRDQTLFFCISGRFFTVWVTREAQFSSVQLLSRVRLCNPMHYSMPGFPVYQQLPELTLTHVHWVSDAIQPSHPLLSPSSPAFNLSQHQDLSQWVSSLHQVVKVLEFQLQHQSIQWTFRTGFLQDWLFGLLAVQGTLKSLLQHHSSKASILRHSAFFIVQFSHPYMTTGKTIALTRQTFVGKVVSLLFNILSRLVIAFLPRSKHLLISWLQSPSAVILEPKKIKSVTVSIVSPSICCEVMGPDAVIFVFWIQPKINSLCPALAGRFLTTGPPGKSLPCLSY